MTCLLRPVLKGTFGTKGEMGPMGLPVSETYTSLHAGPLAPPVEMCLHYRSEIILIKI